MLLALGEVITEAVEEDKSISLKGILTITPIMTKDRLRYNRYKDEIVQEQGHQKVIITAGEQLDKAVVKSLERKERLEEEKKARYNCWLFKNTPELKNAVEEYYAQIK